MTGTASAKAVFKSSSESLLLQRYVPAEEASIRQAVVPVNLWQSGYGSQSVTLAMAMYKFAWSRKVLRGNSTLFGQAATLNSSCHFSFHYPNITLILPASIEGRFILGRFRLEPLMSASCSAP